MYKYPSEIQSLTLLNATKKAGTTVPAFSSYLSLQFYANDSRFLALRMIFPSGEPFRIYLIMIITGSRQGQLLFLKKSDGYPLAFAQEKE